MSRTQLRLQQVTGSLNQAVAAASSINVDSLQGVLDRLASGLNNITGQDFYNVSDSVLKDQNNQSRISYADGAGVIIGAEGDGSTALTIGSAASGDKLVLFGGNAKLADAAYIGSTTTVDLLTFNANDVQVKAGKDLLVDEILESTSAAGVTIDGVLIKDNDIAFPGDVSTIGSNTTSDLLTFNANSVQVKAAKDLLVDEILESTAAAGVTIDGVLIKDNDIVMADGGVTIGSTTTTDALTIATDGTLSSSGNVIIAGDLTVNGTTTTIDTTNLLVEDPVIGMAVNAASQNQNGGLAIFSGSSDSDLVVGRVANDTWGFGKKATLKGTVTTLADMTLVNARASKFEIAGSSDYIDVSTNLQIIAAADIVLNPGGNNVLPGGDSEDDLGADGTAWRKLFVDDIDLNGQGRIDLDTDGDTSIRASADDTIMIEIGAADSIQVSVANSAQVIEAVDSGNPSIFLKPDEGAAVGFNLNGDLSYATIADDVGNDLLQVTGSAGAPTLVAGGALGMGTTQILTISGSQVLIDNGAASGELALRASDGNELRFDAPTGISTSVTYTFPAAPSNGLFLQTDTNGDLSWASAAGGTKKGVKIIAAQVNANTDVSFSSVDVGTAPTDFSTAGSQGDTLDVFVNGQLLLSGSNAQITSTPPTRDFEVTSTTQLRFAFTLEVDDVVTVINR